MSFQEFEQIIDKIMKSDSALNIKRLRYNSVSCLANLELEELVQQSIVDYVNSILIKVLNNTTVGTSQLVQSRAKHLIHTVYYYFEFIEGFVDEEQKVANLNVSLGDTAVPRSTYIFIDSDDRSTGDLLRQLLYKFKGNGDISELIDDSLTNIKHLSVSY